MTKLKDLALIYGFMAANDFTNRRWHPPDRFVIEDIYVKAYEGWLIGGLSKEDAAYKVCASHPVASKLSANERYRWQRQLIQSFNEGE